MNDMPSANPFADGAAYVNGDVVPVGEATIPLTDLGFLRSDVTYDVVHVWDGRFFRLDDHLDRFLASCAKLRFSLPLDRDGIARVLHRVVATAGLKDAYVNMTATRGPLPRGTRDPLQCRNRLYAFSLPFVWITGEQEQEKGVSMMVASPERIPMASFDQTVKNFMWGDLSAALMEVTAKGGRLAVLLDRDGNVTEGPGFNVFVVKGGRLMTADTGVLHGITRKVVIELARRSNMEVVVAPLPVSDLRSADEVFATSTAGGVMPVTSLDGKAIGDGAPGPVSMRLREAYWQAHADPRFSTPVDYALAREAA